jgi:hypothetical protein
MMAKQAYFLPLQRTSIVASIHHFSEICIVDCMMGAMQVCVLETIFCYEAQF